MSTESHLTRLQDEKKSQEKVGHGFTRRTKPPRCWNHTSSKEESSRTKVWKTSESHYSRLVGSLLNGLVENIIATSKSKRKDRHIADWSWTPVMPYTSPRHITGIGWGKEVGGSPPSNLGRSPFRKLDRKKTTR